VLTVLALALLLVVGANTNNLVPFYAIGVFTGFAMAGFGMARYHRKTKEPAWRRRLIINLACGVYTALVVVIFAVVKFTEGAWLVVAVFPVMVFLLIRLNRQYRREASVVEALSTDKPPHPPNFARRTVLVLVDDFDLAAIAALRYARSLHPTALRAVHFVTDQPRADHLLQQWLRADRGVPLDLVDCPTGGSNGRPANSPPRRPASPAPMSPCCCHGAAPGRCSVGSCTTGPPTRLQG
jgi:hypothetical protein